MGWRRRVAAAAALVAAVLLLGVAVRELAFVGRADLAVNRWVAGARPGWLVDAAEVVTLLGAFSVLIWIALGAAAVLAMARVRRPWAPLVALGLVALAYPELKDVFARPRPPIALAVEPVAFFGYPSGHASQSGALWLALGLTTSTALVERGRQRAAHLAAAVGLLLALVIGLTRVVLGVHSPTDLLGGWMLGAACALLVVPALRRGGAPTPSRRRARG